jgi:hypothetical protein
MLISWIRLRMSGDTVGRPPRRLDFRRQYALKPARCQRMIVSGLTIANASLGKQSIEANKYQPIKNTKGLPSRGGTPQNVDLLPKHPDLCLQCCSRSHWVDECPENQPAKISHYAVASADSSLLTNWIKFTLGTGLNARCCTLINAFELVR